MYTGLLPCLAPSWPQIMQIRISFRSRSDLVLDADQVLGFLSDLAFQACISFYGPCPQYGWDFPEEIPEKFRKDPGNALRAFPGIPVESTAGMPQTL